MSSAIVETSLPGLKLFSRGKVRDVYDLGDKLLIVATDRISAFDVVLPTPIPGKGRVLTQISTFWFKRLEPWTQHHLISSDVSAYPPELRRHAASIEGRSMFVKRAKRVDVECVVRGYIAGSAWKEYKRTGGEVWGHRLPAGLQEAARLEQPIFTPTTKEEGGAHDAPLTLAELRSSIGKETAELLERRSLELYGEARRHCDSRGLILADTKFEFGWDGDKLLLIDEALTPDSSRFWDAGSWAPGKTPENFDKQFVRDYLETTGWNKKPPAPALPQEVVEKTLGRYQEAYRKIAR